MCDECATAEQSPSWPGYASGCSLCEARALSLTSSFAQTMAAGKWTAGYRRALMGLCGDDAGAQRAMHQAAEDWAQKREFFRGAREA